MQEKNYWNKYKDDNSKFSTDELHCNKFSLDELNSDKKKKKW